MEKWYSTPGILDYSSSGWLVVNVKGDLQKYYHYLLQKNLHYKLNRPKFGSHITVIAGKYEQVQQHPLWNKYQKQVVNVEYNATPLEADGVFWLVCRSLQLTAIRNELGLSDIPKWPFHITVGNRKNLQS